MGHVLERQGARDGIPVPERYQPGMCAEPLVDLRLNRHLLPAVCCGRAARPRRLDGISRWETLDEARRAPAGEPAFALDDIDCFLELLGVGEVVILMINVCLAVCVAGCICRRGQLTGGRWWACFPKRLYRTTMLPLRSCFQHGVDRDYMIYWF